MQEKKKESKIYTKKKVEKMAKNDENVFDENASMMDNVENINIIEPAELVIDSIVTTNETCQGEDGTATVYVSGGTLGYEYHWMNVDNPRR